MKNESVGESVGVMNAVRERAIVHPDGSPVAEPTQMTERAAQRHLEDERYLPVIVKRTDEARRHPDDILSYAIHEGLEQLQRPGFSLMLSAVAAGLILGSTAMSVAVASQIVQASPWPWAERLALALVYPLGFVVCLMSGTELFTEHTATAVYPVLDRQASWKSLLRLWGLVLSGNLLGAAVVSGLLALADDVIGARQGYLEIGRSTASRPCPRAGRCASRRLPTATRWPSPSPKITSASLPAELGGEGAASGPHLQLRLGLSLKEAEKKLILATLDHVEGDKKEAASVLGVSLKTLYNRLKRYEVPRG